MNTDNPKLLLATNGYYLQQKNKNISVNPRLPSYTSYDGGQVCSSCFVLP
ncbi:hypothetical protein KKA47_04075 [bacterium]|nr:hypothetical protein [bacterium]